VIILTAHESVYNVLFSGFTYVLINIVYKFYSFAMVVFK